MAPKAKAPVLIHKAPVAKAKPKGLQLSAAQWKAYNAAYNAYANAAYKNLAAQYRQQALSAAALNIRKSRLQAAATMRAKAAAAHRVARTAAIAAFAVRMSLQQAKNAHQNQALTHRVYNDFSRHMQALGRAQYVYKGEKAFTHTAVMRTVTSAQAMTLAQAQFNKAIKTAKKAVTSTRTSPAASSQSAAIAAGARAAGLAAAAAVPASQKFSAVQARAKAKAHATAHATASRTAKATIAKNKALRKAGKAKVTPAPRTAPRPAGWMPPFLAEHYGDPDGFDCVAAAIAAHRVITTGHDLPIADYERLIADLGPAPSIEKALDLVLGMDWDGPRLTRFGLREPETGTRLIAGFPTATGDHAAVLLSDSLVISWGEVLLLESVVLPGAGIEESWELTWG